MLTDLAETGRTDLPIQMLRIERGGEWDEGRES